MNQEQENLPIKKAKTKSKPKPKAKPQAEFPVASQAKTSTKPKPKAKPQAEFPVASQAKTSTKPKTKIQPKRESRTVMTESHITGVDYKTIEVNATEVSKMEAEVVQTEIDQPLTKKYWEVDPTDTFKSEPKESNDKTRIVLFLVIVTAALLAYSYFTR
jgi:hypothetical protein